MEMSPEHTATTTSHKDYNPPKSRVVVNSYNICDLNRGSTTTNNRIEYVFRESF